MKPLSDEQELFVEYPNIIDSKLFAPPGSGKSTCIIRRQIYLVEHELLKKNQSIIISFSRNSRKDIEERVFQYPNYFKYFQVSPSKSIENIRTIDSLSYNIQAQMGITPRYEDLSYDLSCILNQRNLVTTDLRELEILSDLKLLFVDEAQDLDCYQYNIIIKLQQILNLKVILVGDPNQSIYKFKKASPEFMNQFPATEFYLTKNFRSTPAIVAFAEYLKPHKVQGKETKSFAHNQINIRPQIDTNSFQDFWKRCLQFIHNFTGDKSEIAMLSPTKGHSSKSNFKFFSKFMQLHGLARLSNLLDFEGIPFVQAYNESSDSDNQCSFETKPGHINLLTFHGCKGKEWNTVICFDVWHELMNCQPSQSDLTDQQYLLFVAMTRARENLIIHIEPTEHNYMKQRLPNQYLTLIPPEMYNGKFNYIPKTFPIKERDISISSIKEIVKNMSHEMRSELRNIVKWNVRHEERIYNDYREVCQSIVKHDNILFGEFLENLFSMQCSCHRFVKPREIDVVSAFLNGKKVLLNKVEFSIIYPLWDDCSSWMMYDSMKKNISNRHKELVDKHFTRSIDWKNHFLTNENSFGLLWDQYSLVRDCYETYMNMTLKWKDKIQSLFFLTVIRYTYGNNHLFHIRDAAKSKMHLIHPDLHELFEDMNKYAAKLISTSAFSEQIHCTIPYLNVSGNIDVRFVDGKLMETKACKDITAFSNVCQVFLYLLSDMTTFADLTTREVILYNFLSGEVLNLQFDIEESFMIRLFTILSKSSGHQLNSMSLCINVEGTDSAFFTSVQDEEYEINWLHTSNLNVEVFQNFINCMDGKCKFVYSEDTSMKSQNRLQQQKKLLQEKGIIFKHKVGNNIKAQHEIEIPWVDVAWIRQNEPLWGIQHENSSKTTELKKYRKADSDISFY